MKPSSKINTMLAFAAGMGIYPSLPEHKSDWQHDPERLRKAEEKRLRKMNRNKETK